MKSIYLFILVLASCNIWGKEFTCLGGRAEYEELKWDVQNYQEYDQEYKAGVHYLLYFCQMAYGETEAAFHNLKMSADLGNISANFQLAKYYFNEYLNGHEAVQNHDCCFLLNRSFFCPL